MISQSFEGDSTQPLSALKLLVGLVINPESTCPHDILSKILRKTLDVLYRRHDLDQLSCDAFFDPDESVSPALTQLGRPRMAVWLRAIVTSLLHRRELEEARKYVENAAHFIRQPQVRRAADRSLTFELVDMLTDSCSVLAVHLSVRGSGLVRCLVS